MQLHGGGTVIGFSRTHHKQVISFRQFEVEFVAKSIKLILGGNKGDPRKSRNNPRQEVGTNEG
jgi:hypothetical protein